MTQAMAVANEFFNNPVEYRRYRDQEMIRRDRVSEREGLLAEGIGIGREEGIGIGREEGIGIGREEGREESIAKVACRLSVAEAARIFDMSEAKIREIAARFGIGAS